MFIICSTRVQVLLINPNNILAGTQGGTFTRQWDSPFERILRTRNGRQDRQSRQDRQDSSSSDSGSDSEQSAVTEDDRSTNAGESSGITVFVASDNHSINGETIITSCDPTYVFRTRARNAHRVLVRFT